MLVRFEQEAAKRSEKLTGLYDEQIQKLTGQLNLNKGEVQEIAQSFGVKLPSKFDIKGLGGLPIDPKKPLDLNGIGKALPLPKPDAKLPKFGLQPDTDSNPGVRQANDVENTIEGLGSLFGKKKKPAPKTIQPAAGQQPNSK